MTKRNVPLAKNIVVEVWEERDRLHIHARMAPEVGEEWPPGSGKTRKRATSEKTVAEWWDDDARQMFEDGFFKPGIVRRPLDQVANISLTNSVRAYLVSVGLAK